MGRAGVAYVEIKFSPGDLERMQAEAKANGNIIADEMSQSADKNGGFFRKFISGFEDIGRGVQNTTDDFGKFISESSFANGALAPFGQTVSSLAPLLGVLTTVTTAFGAALLVLPALAAAATFVLVALLDVVTTLSAAVAALAGPLSIVGVLLGGLGVGFVLAGKRALAGGGPFKEFASTVEDLGKQFKGVIRTLALDFLPLFDRLAGAAKTALTYLGQVAKLPLKKAFESLSTTGVAMFSKFVYGVANVLKKPFTLAIKLAFGSGGGNAQSAITGWWDSLTKYLFGYTATHKIKLNDHVISISKSQVDGALKPILDWFNRQHLTATGEKWSNEIIQGFLRSNGAKNLGKWARTTADHAGTEAGKAFKATFTAEISAIGPWLKHYWSKHWQDIETGGLPVVEIISGWIRNKLGDAWTAVKAKAKAAWDSIKSNVSSAVGNIGTAIENHVGAAWEWVKSKAQRVWDIIKGLFESAISIHINWPSPPSWLGSLGSGAAAIATGGASLVTHRAMGGPVTAGTPYIVGEHRPELFVPERNGTIVPSIGGDTTVQVFIDSKEIESAVYKVQRRTARAVQAGSRWG